MKSRTFVLILIFVLSVLFIVGSCATKKGVVAEKEYYISKFDEELYGTWINEEYNSAAYKGKKRLYHWGYYEDYRPADSEVVQYKGTIVIVDKWTDSEGNIWYKTYYRISGSSTIFHELDKISNNGNTWEYAYTSVDFPSESDLNPDNTRYRIYYRQE
jgi:hypothetical protein